MTMGIPRGRGFQYQLADRTCSRPWCDLLQDQIFNHTIVAYHRMILNFDLQISSYFCDMVYMYDEDQNFKQSHK